MTDKQTINFEQAFQKSQEISRFIAEYKSTAQELVRQLAEVKLKQAAIEFQTLVEVTNATDEAGKKKYSNEKLRQGEQSQRLKHNEDYKHGLMETTRLERAIEHNQIQLDYKLREFSLYKRLLDYLILTEKGDNK